MNKRKLFTLALSLAMIAILAIGGTIAYFTDEDEKTNVFTIGNIDITLIDEFEQGSKLMPATGSAQDGTIENEIKKEVGVTVEDESEPAWVRVHIAIPQILDDGDPSFNAAANTLHFNFEPESVVEGQWDWSKSADDGKTTGNWNFYTQKIDDIWYNVYVVHYTTPVKPGKSTATYAMHQVYLDSLTTLEQVENIKKVLGNKWMIKVVAEGAQAVGFNDAFTALNTSFGKPGTYTVNWPADSDIYTDADVVNP